MGLLNKITRRFSQTSVSEKPSKGQPDVAEDAAAEQRVDYSCPTLKDVSVRNGDVGGDRDGAREAVDDIALVDEVPGNQEGLSPGAPDVADMRSELDTMSMGSVSELASEDADPSMSSSFNAAMAKRDMVSRILTDLEREEAEVRASLAGAAGENGPLQVLVKKYNDVAVGCMEGSSLDQSLACLLKAERLLCDAEREDGDTEGAPEISRLRSITYNNLGCLYRRKAEPEKALRYLQNALKIEEGSADPKVNELASTHLNLSASYSVLNKDVEALRHGERAIVLLQGRMWPGLSFKDGMEMLLSRIAREGGTVAPQLMRDAHVLSMAYHNVGTQNERLGRIREAQVSFNRACSIGTKILGPSDRTTVTVQLQNKIFLQRNGGLARSKPSSGMLRSKSGVALNAKSQGGASTAKAAAHSRTKSSVGSKGGGSKSKK
jgi:tetratricopeptide (TPR) repeat protein